MPLFAVVVKTIPLSATHTTGRTEHATVPHSGPLVCQRRPLGPEQVVQQSKYDPCYFWKFLSDGTRMDLVMYVDDGYVIDEYSAAADAELALLHAAFTIDVKPAAFFLGNNVVVHDADGASPAAAAVPLAPTGRACTVCGYRSAHGLQYACRACGYALCWAHRQGHDALCEAIVARRRREPG